MSLINNHQNALNFRFICAHQSLITKPLISNVLKITDNPIRRASRDVVRWRVTD